MAHLSTKACFFYEKSLNSINTLYTGSYKIILIYYGERMKNFKSIFLYVCIERSEM